MANQRRSMSWLSLSSVRRPATATTTTTAPPPARSDSIRPPAFKPFRLPATAQPQKPTSPPTAPSAATATPVQPPDFRTASTAKTATSPSAAPPQSPAFRQLRPAPPVSQPVTFPPAAGATMPAAAQRSSPPLSLAPTSSAVSNAKALTTTAPAPPKPQPLQPLVSDRELKPKVVVPAAPETEHKTVLVQQLTDKKSNLVPPNVETKHHKLQSTAQIAKAGVLAFQDKAVAMQRKYLESKKNGTRVVRLVGNNTGAVMVLNSSRKKYDYGAKPKTLQSESSTSTLFMNSNVQGVNNSMAFDSCLTHHDPGLHVSTYEP